MLDMLKKILSLLAVSERKKLYWLVAAIMVMSVVDMVGIASIFPFLSVISNPKIIETSSKLKMVYDKFGFTDKGAFLIALGGLTFVLLVISDVVRALVNIAILRVTWLKRQTISTRLLSQYLYSPYTFFLNRNSSQLVNYLVSEVAKVVSDVLIPCMQIFARSLLAILVLGLLFAVDYIVATVVVVVIGGGYTMIYMFTRKQLSHVGEKSIVHNQRMYKVLYEAFGGIKDVKLLGKEQAFIAQYSSSVKELVRCYSDRFLVAQFPRYAFEIIAFGGILFIITYLILIKKDYQQVIPLVGLYAFAAFRLMPTLQMIFQDFTSLKFARSALDRIHLDFFNCTVDHSQKAADIVGPLPFQHHIKFCNVTFQYPKAQKPVIQDLNLTIKINTTIGLVGSTGAGKTTLIDILLGLLRPVNGELTVDDVTLSEDNLRMWQKNIGYVPQHIYICDDTVKRNIAFGVPDNEIDGQAVLIAAKQANIHDFVEKELPQQYETEVGERGIRLSGGQRQRIGIARALYRNPSLIVFDEATSALDGITEDVILEAIHHLAHKKTIVIIAHRLSTVKECDCIYFLEQGRIVSQGTYQELLAGNPSFRKMAKVS